MYAREKTCLNTRVKAGVGVVVIGDKGEILLERRKDTGMWGLPGGAIDNGESLLQAISREVREETGLEVRITGLLGINSDPAEGRIVTYQDNGDIVQLFDAILTAEIISGNLTLSNQSLELKFFDLETLPTDIFLSAVKPIQDYTEGKSGVISRRMCDDN